MAKNKLSGDISHLNAKEAVAEALGLTEIKRPYKIVSAKIVDGFCHYGVEVVEGVGLGDKIPTVKGAGLYDPDMGNAFGKLHVHLACIDDAFKLSEVAIDDIDKFHAHEITSLFHVTGIKIVGSDENEAVVITGSKHISCTGGRIEISTPRIPIDELSSYKWHNELKSLVDRIREEVALYKEGKYTLAESEDEEEHLSHREKGKRIKQRTIGEEIAERMKEQEDDRETEESDQNGPVENEDIDLENSRV